MDYYLWIKAFHVIAVVAWFAGLFYLPRLFVYHTSANAESHTMLCTMECKLYKYITNPAGMVATTLGLILIGLNPSIMSMGWIHAKITLVVLLWAYHISLGRMVKTFANQQNKRPEKFYRMYNEVPTIVLIIVVLLAIVKPF